MCGVMDNKQCCDLLLKWNWICLMTARDYVLFFEKKIKSKINAEKIRILQHTAGNGSLGGGGLPSGGGGCEVLALLCSEDEDDEDDEDDDSDDDDDDDD